MDRFTNGMLAVIRKYHMIEAGDAVTVGFSGGGDSAALLTALWSIRRLLRCELRAVHVNHGIRGREADDDEAFCRQFCRERDIPFSAVRVDVPAFAAETGSSVEETARLLRYRALGQAAERPQGGRARIAVAHHAGDQAETILLQLCRGSGLRGLGGMQPVRGNVIRPLIETEQAEIQSYLSSRKIPYVTDSTNLSAEYTRNYLRLEILPRLAAQVNERAAGHLCFAGAQAAQADAYFTRLAGAYLEEASGTGEQEGKKYISLNRRDLKEKEQIVRRYVIIEALRSIGAGGRDWGEKHFASVDEAMFRRSGYHLDLPQGVSCDNTYREMILSICRGKENEL